LLIVTLLAVAEVPASILGIKFDPVLVMVTSVELVGTVRLHQLLAVAQSVLVPPTQPAPLATVILDSGE
jgi:hypothetical protein